MLLAHHLFEHVAPGVMGDIEAWVGALRAAQLEARGEIQVLWEGATELERRVMKVIANRTIPLGGREADARFDLVRGGSTKGAVARLFTEGHIVADDATRTGWRIVDPFLGVWLREG